MPLNGGVKEIIAPSLQLSEIDISISLVLSPSGFISVTKACTDAATPVLTTLSPT